MKRNTLDLLSLVMALKEYSGCTLLLMSLGCIYLWEISPVSPEFRDFMKKYRKPTILGLFYDGR